MNRKDNSKAAPVSTSIQDSKLFDKAKKDKKKKQHRNKKDSRDSTTLVTGVNMVMIKDKKKRRNKDKGEVMCFNCDKKKHYTNKYCRAPKSKS